MGEHLEHRSRRQASGAPNGVAQRAWQRQGPQGTTWLGKSDHFQLGITACMFLTSNCIFPILTHTIFIPFVLYPAMPEARSRSHPRHPTRDPEHTRRRAQLRRSTGSPVTPIGGQSEPVAGGAEFESLSRRCCVTLFTKRAGTTSNRRVHGPHVITARPLVPREACRRCGTGASLVLASFAPRLSRSEQSSGSVKRGQTNECQPKPRRIHRRQIMER
jgi:hypothetical protein